MKLVILGDIHGRWAKANAIVNHELKECGIVLCTGDLCNYDFSPRDGQKMVFSWGNHESMKGIAELLESEGLLLPLRAGQIHRLTDGTNIAALPGVYSEHLYKSSNTLRYYTQGNVDAVKNLGGIDILLTHEAPIGIGVLVKDKDAGRPEIRDIVECLQPKVHIFGHHHANYDAVIGKTRVFGMDLLHRSYALLETDDFNFTRIPAEIKTLKRERKQYFYGWEGGACD